jgi:hypothetical protein
MFFYFSFKINCNLVQVINMKVAPNNIFYLQENFHIFLTNLAIFPGHGIIYVLLENG